MGRNNKSFFLFFQYLEFNALQKTADLFEEECEEKDKPIEPNDSKQRVNSKLLDVQVSMTLTLLTLHIRIQSSMYCI